MSVIIDDGKKEKHVIHVHVVVQVVVVTVLSCQLWVTLVSYYFTFLSYMLLSLIYIHILWMLIQRYATETAAGRFTYSTSKFGAPLFPPICSILIMNVIMHSNDGKREPYHICAHNISGTSHCTTCNIH